jgi:hypothetical protein
MQIIKSSGIYNIPDLGVDLGVDLSVDLGVRVSVKLYSEKKFPVPPMYYTLPKLL